MSYSIPVLDELIDEFRKMPSVGTKSAERMAFYVLGLSDEEVKSLTDAISGVHEKVRQCAICRNLTEDEVCPICQSDTRDKTTICVVESPRDVLAFERTHEYNGLYHVLQGLISPMDGIGADDIRIKELLNRLTSEEVKEIILALPPSVEGEATSLYLTKLIKPFGITISRIAFGLPVGADLEYADEITIAKAIEGRREIL